MRRALLLLAALAGGCGTGADTPAPRNAPAPTPATSAAPAPAKPAWRPAKVVADAPERPARRVTAGPGEGLATIARREGVGAATLARANGLQPPYALAPGQALTVPAGRYHVVKPGETLSNIARAYRADWRTVAAANALGPPYPLEVGDIVLVPTRPAPRPTTLEQRVAQNDLDIDRLIKGAPAPAAPRKPRPAPGSAPPPVAQVPAIRFDWPLEGRIVSGFGRKPGGRVNDGLNIAAPVGATVRAAAEGQVIYAGTGVPAFGALVLVRHAGGWITAYGHNSELLVAKGDNVARSQPIARVGQSGEVDSPQLHFEIRRGRTPVDPAALLPPRPQS